MKNKLPFWGTSRSLSFVRKFLFEVLPYDILRKIGFIADDAKRSDIFRTIKKIKKEKKMMMIDPEAYQIYESVKQTGKIEGEIAEVGVYNGGSAKLICEAKGNKPVHLFDTFDGLPAPSKEDNPEQFHEGQYACSLDQVRKYLSQYPFVHIYKGLFPSTAGPIFDKKFSLVFLDVDLYESTLNCLNFFYPRMNKGGIIMSHNYLDAPGVRKAIDGFFKDKPEPVIGTVGSLCLIVKV